MVDELDLEHGDADLADRIEAENESKPRIRETASSRRRDRVASQKARSAPGASGGDKLDAEIASRLDRTFLRISGALQARGDEELSSVVSEDRTAMTQGLVSLTHAVKPLRTPLLMGLNLIEPILAFGRVARILLTRMALRRQQAGMQNDYENQQNQ